MEKKLISGRRLLKPSGAIMWQKYLLHMTITGSKRVGDGPTDACLPLGPICFISMQFSAKKLPNKRLAAPSWVINDDESKSSFQLNYRQTLFHAPQNYRLSI